MQAAVYRGVNDVRVETVPVPAIGPGEVLIEVHSCGICGTDLKKIHSTGSHSAPRIFGHETVGNHCGRGSRRWSHLRSVTGWLSSTTSPAARCYYCRKKTFAQCPVYKQVGCTRRASSPRAADSPAMCG
jgi:L-iditol 2-dehydrogenase